MDKRAVAIKCFVYCLSFNGWSPVERRQAWMLRGLRLWHEATGEDVSQNVRDVKRWGGTSFPTSLVGR